MRVLIITVSTVSVCKSNPGDFMFIVLHVFAGLYHMNVFMLKTDQFETQYKSNILIVLQQQK